MSCRLIQVRPLPDLPEKSDEKPQRTTKSHNNLSDPLLSLRSAWVVRWKIFTFSDLSIGTRRVIRILTSLLFDKRSLMLLEEPETIFTPSCSASSSACCVPTPTAPRSSSRPTRQKFSTSFAPKKSCWSPLRKGRRRPGLFLLRRSNGPGSFFRMKGHLSDFLEPIGQFLTCSPCLPRIGRTRRLWSS